MWKAIKVSFLYIGTAIGAGFSSGKEIALFFGNLSPINVAISAIFIAALMALFLIAGKFDAVPHNFGVRVAVFMSASVSLVAMLAGSEFVMRTLTGIPMLGIAMTLLGGIVVVCGIEKIKLLNTVLVPLLIVTIAVIFMRVDAPVNTDGFSYSKPLFYSALDVLLSGIIISREGKKLSMKQIVLSCVFTGLFIGGMLFMLQTVVLSDKLHSSMPVLAVAEGLGLKWACGILVSVAIFTTLVSALHLVAEEVQSNLKKCIGKCEILTFTRQKHRADICKINAENSQKYGVKHTKYSKLNRQETNNIPKRNCPNIDKTSKQNSRNKSKISKLNCPNTDKMHKQNSSNISKISKQNFPSINRMPKQNCLRNLAKKTSVKSNFALVVFAVLLFYYPLSFIGFDNIVNFGYPFVSFFGIIMMFLTLIKLACVLIRNKRSSHGGEIGD